MAMRTRFAPSPTGYLHIGGVRTALYNWLLARRHGGQFILRIDDTDASRNRAEAVQPILDGFAWLGLNWDEGPTPDGSGESAGPHAPYFQSQRNDTYVSAAMRLMAEGKAYPDYTTPAEQDERRKAAEKAKRPYVHRGSNRDVPPADNLRQYQASPAPILLKVEPGQAVVWDDLVRGRVEVASDTVRDPALLRAPNAAGVCGALYSFATVVDEVAFGITHVVRAEEHLSNTPTQLLVYQALGATPPAFAHVPLINYNGKKMSKRDLPQLTSQEVDRLRACGLSSEEIARRGGPAGDLNIATVTYYRELGYLPAALVNYLVRLGWSLDDHTEVIPLDVAVAQFDLARVTKAAANFDPKKLYWLQGEYMKLVPTAEKIDKAVPYLRRAGLVGDTLDAATRDRLAQVVEASGDRIKLFSDLVQFAGPLLKETPDYDPAAVAKTVAPNAELLRSFQSRLRAEKVFESAVLEPLLHAHATEAGVKANGLIAAVRVAVIGTTVGFGLYETLAILGREECLRRIDFALDRLS